MDDDDDFGDFEGNLTAASEARSAESSLEGNQPPFQGFGVPYLKQMAFRKTMQFRSVYVDLGDVTSITCNLTILNTYITHMFFLDNM